MDDPAEDVNGVGNGNGVAQLREHSPQERSPREAEAMSRVPSAAASGQKSGAWEKGHCRDGSGSGGLEGLKRRIGSLRRKDQ